MEVNWNTADQMRLRAELEWLREAPDLLLPPAAYRCPEALRYPQRVEPDALRPTGVDWRLGNHFENIIYQYLNYNSQTTDIKRNIQTRSARRTLGEMDFLVRFDGHWVHLEVALKLYLLDGSGSGLADFLGTRRDDSLAAKWTHMINHQLRLAEHPAARETLAQLGIDERPRPALWVKGWLFYPFGCPLPRPTAPINPHHQKGWWLTQSRLERLADQGEYFLLPGKTEWLLPAGLMDAPVFDLEGLRTCLSGAPRANLVVAVSQTPQGLRELSRGFVVTDDWPGAPC